MPNVLYGFILLYVQIKVKALYKDSHSYSLLCFLRGGVCELSGPGPRRLSYNPWRRPAAALWCCPGGWRVSSQREHAYRWSTNFNNTDRQRVAAEIFQILGLYCTNVCSTCVAEMQWNLSQVTIWLSRWLQTGGSSSNECTVCSVCNPVVGGRFQAWFIVPQKRWCTIWLRHFHILIVAIRQTT